MFVNADQRDSAVKYFMDAEFRIVIMVKHLQPILRVLIIIITIINSPINMHYHTTMVNECWSIKGLWLNLSHSLHLIGWSDSSGAMSSHVQGLFQSPGTLKPILFVQYGIFMH